MGLVFDLVVLTHVVCAFVLWGFGALLCCVLLLIDFYDGSVVLRFFFDFIVVALVLFCGKAFGL